MPHPKSGYYNAEGKRVPGTTTILGRFKDSGGLMFWAFQQGKDGAERLYDQAEKAADIGTLAHDMAEKYILGEDPGDALDGVDPEHAQKAENAFQEFLTWERQTNVEWVSVEDTMVSEEYQFGGTPDAVGKIDGDLVLIDFKTSNKIYPDYLIQVAAYRELWNENHPDQPLSETTYILRFSKDFPDFEARKFGAAPEAWEQFKLFRKAYDLDKQLKKRVK